ncbi:MAG: PocR ligand-binding domain-containing protein [Candidatus Omnitrophota bacterium]
MLKRIKRNLRNRQLSIKDLLDIRQWQKIQDNFSAVTDVNLRLLDHKGSLLTSPCKEIRLYSELLEASLGKNSVSSLCLPTFLGGKGVIDKNLSFVSPPGLHNFVAPLRINGGKVLGYLVVGPVILVRRRTKEEYRKIAQELNLDLEQLWSALLEIKVVSFHGAQSLLELIKDLGEYTIRLAYQNIIKQKEIMMAAGSPKLIKFLEALLDVAFEISKAQIGSVMFFDKVKDELRIHASRGIAEDIVQNTRIKPGIGISGIAAKEGRSFLLDENTSDNRITPYLNRPQLSSSMVIPLKIENRVVGVMNIGALNTSDIKFNKDNMDIMRRLVDLAALAMHT